MVIGLQLIYESSSCQKLHPTLRYAPKKNTTKEQARKLEPLGGNTKGTRLN